jgi:hypothetical protein
MPDIYESLMGTPTDDAAKLAELARKLRGQNSLGLIAQASGDRILSPIGKQMMTASDDQAQFMGQEGAKQRDLVEGARVADQTNARQLEINAENVAQRRDAARQASLDRALQRQAMGEARAERLTLAQQAAQEKQDQKAQQFSDKQIAGLTTRMQANNMPGLLGAAESLNNTFAKYKGKSSIPGVGPLENTLPNWMMSTEGQVNRGDLAEFANQVLKLRSGAAVTDQELRRFLNEIATGTGVSEETFKKRWPKIMQHMEKVQNQLLAGVDDVDREEYFRRTGYSPFKAADPFSDEPAAGSGKRVVGGKTYKEVSPGMWEPE